MRLYFVAVFLLVTRCGFAHMDPLGEVHPQLTANQDGSFTVTFRYYDNEREGRMRMMVGADGKELVPRHWIKKGADESEWGFPSKTPPGIRYIDPAKEGALARALVIQQADHDVKKTTARTLPAIGPGNRGEALSAAGKEVAFVYGDELERKDEGMPFHLSWCRSDGFHADRTVLLGMVGCIYDYPSASSLVWSGGRWWVAWVKGNKKDDKSTWTTVLSSVDAASGKVEHHDLPGNSNWNTGLTLAVNAAGTFCVAWHASVDGTYPGKSKIVTAVFTPAK